MQDKLDQLNAELETVNEQLAELARLQRYEQLTRQAVTEIRQRLHETRQQYHHEFSEVTNLERVSLERLWHAIAGNLEAIRDQEKRSLVVAASSLKLTDDAYRAVSKQLRKIQARIRRMGDLNAERERLLQEKEALLSSLGRAADQATQARLGRLRADLAHKRDQVRQVFEALAVTDRIEEQLAASRRQLQEIDAWQQAESPDDDQATVLAKHEHIGQTIRTLQTMQQTLGQLQRELADIDRTFSFPFNPDSLEIFNRGFLQGFHVEWLVENRLQDTQWGLNGVEHAVEAVQEQLAALRKQLAREIGQIEAELRSALEDWGTDDD